MNLSTTQIKDTYGNLVTIGTVAGTPTTGTLQNGAGSDLTSITLNGAAVFNEGGGDFDFRVEGLNDTNLLFVDASADRVGIGTSAPQYTLHVDSGSSTSTIRVEADTGINPLISFLRGTTDVGQINGAFDGLQMNGFQVVKFDTGGTERLRITSAGNVGIGTISPAAKLSVEGSAIFNDAGADVDFRIEGDTDANLLFVDASTDRVGIGTSAPDALLTVDGVASFGDGAVGTPSIANQGDLDTGLWFPAPNVIAVSTQGAEAARVTANGAVLIGTTSASQGQPDAAGSLIVDDFIGMNLGTNKVYTNQGQVTATTGTIVYTFSLTGTTAQTMASYVKMSIMGRVNTNNAADLFAAEYHFVLHKNNATPNVTTLNGQSSIYEYTIDYATDVAFADLGNGVCTVTITNPIGSTVNAGTKVEIQSGFLTTQNFGFTLTSVTYT